MKLTLASSSEYRKTILKKLCIPFDAISPEIDESAINNESINDQVLRLAINKAQAISKLKPTHYVIGSDQLASCNGQTLGKPGNFQKAKSQLLMMSDQTVTFHTGLCLANHSTNQLEFLVELFEVKFKPLTEKQISIYLNIEQPYNCAGSFKSEGLGIALFDSLSGRDPNTLMGLPLIALIGMFKNLSVDLFDYMQNSDMQ
ncbi:Maf family protein [Paraglaciecola aquimarina]|uniref:7-methyl-GTP pyrophosphatase n=1 Tax=Paraglaciecola aquimarina TaxID=1235557 RepID=A0ABU3SZ74_9ALTE|nr:Maf family protein [Paraglaciecola aquimarina]MDU0355315.1 Maf family protein [Paraglaciecola aquimarina]